MLWPQLLRSISNCVLPPSRTTKNLNIAALGAILAHRCGAQGTIEEEDEADQNVEEDQEGEEYKLDIDEAAEYIDEVFETSDNFISHAILASLYISKVSATLSGWCQISPCFFCLFFLPL